MNKNLLLSYVAKAGLTQGELAKKIGISANTLSATMNGKRHFKTIEIERISKVLDIKDRYTKADIFLK